MRCGGEFAKRIVVILIDPVSALCESEVSFCQIRLELNRGRSFRACLRFPGIGWLVKMEDLSRSRGQSGAGQRKPGIKRDRLQIKLIGFLEILEQRIGVSLNLICL